MMIFSHDTAGLRRSKCSIRLKLVVLLAPPGTLQRFAAIEVFAPLALAVVSAEDPGKEALAVLLDAGGLLAVAPPDMGRCRVDGPHIIRAVVRQRLDVLDLLGESVGIAAEDALDSLHT
jgi:hypothetical protein